MQEGPLRIDGLDCLSEEEFVLYFSDDTKVKVTSQNLADLFPQRQPCAPESDTEGPGPATLDA